MTNSNITTTQEGAVAPLSAEDIELMRAAAPTKDFKKDDLLIPYLLIVQATSGYVQRNNPDFTEDARPGDILDTLTRTPRQKVAFVPVRYETTYTEWKPNRGGMVKQWGTDSSRYDASGTHYGTRQTPEGNDIVPSATYYGLVVLEDASTMPVVLNMTGSQYKKSKRLNSLIDMLEETAPDGTKFTPPSYSRVYQMETVGESNDFGAWHGWRIEPGPMLLQVRGGREVFQKAQKLREQIDTGIVRAAPAPVTPAVAPDAARNPDEIPF